MSKESPVVNGTSGFVLDINDSFHLPQFFNEVALMMIENDFVIY